MSVRNLHVQYGGIRALNDVSMDVDDGQTVALIGANGAGKSTLLRTISGLVEASGGSIEFKGQNILGMPSYEIVRRGTVMVPEGRRVFPGLTVMENLRLGAYTVSDKAEAARNLESVLGLFPLLKERLGQRAGLLSGGEQQMLAVGRALMSRAELIMMDEPSLGLAPKLVRNVFAIIRQIREMGRTVLLAEQNARGALSLADYVYVLETGRVVLQGTAEQVGKSDDVRKAYLGVA